MEKLKQGDTAPEFKLMDQNSKFTDLASFKGEKLLVYFYPEADTPGCTRQAQSVEANLAELANLDVMCVGISPDPVESQKRFAEKYKLEFPLLSDYDHKVAAAFGVWDDEMGGIIRSSFLIDENGKIIDAQYGVKPEDTVPKAMEALQTAAK